MTGKVIQLYGSTPPQVATLPDLSDEELASLVSSAANQQAFAILVQRHARKAHAMAYRLLLNPTEAEDVVQESFTKYWQRPSAWNPDKGAKFGTWFTQVVLNASRDRLRKKPWQPLPDGDVLPYEETAEKIVMHSQLKALLLKAVSTLPQRQREALVLCVFEERSHKEAADVLNISPKAVESLIGRAKTHLRSYFSEKG